MSIRPSAIASGLCALALGQAALAGGPIDPGPAAEAIEILPASDWSGTYVGIAAAAVAEELGGTVVVLGTPGEEGGGGKVVLALRAMLAARAGGRRAEARGRAPR